ncbi:MAG: flagellar hook-basal body complex protein FliE [Alkaliphilus sp.]|nr:flagellar hook-basal body complex protein FliE [Alkaliphilus transvaalensis]MBN4069407.1 flagellar hook-basal body complex protein FliE [bacterium AH-315-G05]PHS35240.1 MAG: flagellar hook-basal body complex protein FliE [Alkaliphilus sp.]
MKIQELNNFFEIGNKSNLGLFEDEKLKSGTSFADLFAEAISNANALEKKGELLAEDLATGKLDNIHEIMINTQKSEIAMQLVLQVRNKVLDAYREISRMQI